MALAVKVFADGRSAERRKVDADATVRDVRMVPVDARVLDLSETGFRIATEIAFDIGQRITLGFGGWGMREAKVVRADGLKFGCEFLVPLPRDVLEQGRHAVTLVEGQFNLLAVPKPEQPVSFEPNPFSESKFPASIRIPVAFGAAALLWAAIAAAYALVA